SAEAVGIDAGELALGCVEVIAKIVEVAVDPQGLASAEQVAVGVVGADAGSVDGGVAGSAPDQVALALGDVGEDRQIAVRIKRLALAHAHRAQALHLRNRAAHVGQGLRRIGVAGLRVDEGTHRRRVDVLGAANRDLTDPSDRPQINYEGHVQTWAASSTTGSRETALAKG